MHGRLRLAILASVLMVPSGYAQLQNVDDRVSVELGQVTDDRRSGTRRVTATVTNASEGYIGDLRLVVGNVPADTPLTSATGATEEGDPYVEVTSALPPGAKASVTLQFRNPSRARIDFTTIARGNPNTFLVFGPQEYARGAGAPAPVTAGFAVADETLPYRMAVETGGVSSAMVALNGEEAFGLGDFNTTVSLLAKSITVAPENELSVELRGSPGERLTVAVVGIGAVPPTIETSVVPEPNAAGWHNSDVTVSFECASTTSKIEFCSEPVIVSADTAGLVVSGTAQDAAGNTAAASVTVRLDKTPPSLSISSPAGGSIVSSSPIPMTGAAIDGLSGLAGVSCDGVPASVVGSAFSCGVSLVEGLNTVNVSAMDVAGNSSVVALELNYAPAPTVTFSQPAHLSYLNISPTTVTGTVDGPVQSLAVNSIPAVVANGRFSMALPLREGPNIVTATATSPAGAVGTSSIEVTLDTTPPRVTITSPPGGFVTTEPTITVVGNINDIVVGTVNEEQAQVRVNGVDAEVANRTFLAMDVPLSLGENVIQAVGRDRVGNSATTQITVTRAAPSESRIQLISGNNQTATIGSGLALPLVVALTDSGGAPAANRPVIFKVTQNNGMVSAGAQPAATVIANTNAQGQAQAGWTLGMRAGAGGNVVEAYSVGFGGTAIFTATGMQGTAGKIVVDTGNNQVGEINKPLPKPFIAVVVDEGNNRLAGVPVTFTVKEGGGGFAGAASVTSVTDSDGRAAATLTLGFQEGDANNLVEANFPSNQGFPAAFRASGRAPGDPARTTISGVVLDNSNVPIPGVTVRAVLTNQMTSNSNIIQSVAVVQTDAEGQFTIPEAPVGFVKLLVDGSTAQRPGTYPTLDYDLVTVAGQNNTVTQPIFLLPLTSQDGLCVTATSGGGTLTMADVPGFSLTFGPGQVTFPGGSKDGCISVTAVHSDKVPMEPGFGQQPRFIVTIQPAGAVFSPPAPMTLPNVDGLAPRAVTEMYSFDHDIGSFVAIGTGTVSDDGRVVSSDPGIGVLKAGWHCGGDPATRGTVADCPPCTYCQGATDTSVSCIPDPDQAGQTCNSRFNNCYEDGTGLCGLDGTRPTGECIGGIVKRDGSTCDSAGSREAICVDGTCTGVGDQCPINCDDNNPTTIDYCANGACHHEDIDDNFCRGQPFGAPCGVCRTGATCDPAGRCSGGTPSETDCGPCMTGSVCTADGGCAGGVPVPNGTACADGGICTNGTCRSPEQLQIYQVRTPSGTVQISANGSFVAPSDEIRISARVEGASHLEPGFPI